MSVRRVQKTDLDGIKSLSFTPFQVGGPYFPSISLASYQQHLFDCLHFQVVFTASSEEYTECDYMEKEKASPRNIKKQ